MDTPGQFTSAGTCRHGCDNANDDGFVHRPAREPPLVQDWLARWRNGERLAVESGARLDVVRLFAFFHDACRESDGADPGHGPRAAELAAHLHGSHYALDQAGLALLVQACEGHTHEPFADDPTVQTCWDSDRLDLGRLDIFPDHRRLGTEAAKRREVILWAYRWGQQWRMGRRIARR